MVSAILFANARNSFARTKDIGEAAVACLMEGPVVHADRFYDITGPEPQSMIEIATDLDNVMGKKIEHGPQSSEGK